LTKICKQSSAIPLEEQSPSVYILFTKEEIEAVGIEYVIGGIHWRLYSKPDRESA